MRKRNPQTRDFNRGAGSRGRDFCVGCSVCDAAAGFPGTAIKCFKAARSAIVCERDDGKRLDAESELRIQTFMPRYLKMPRTFHCMAHCQASRWALIGVAALLFATAVP